MQVANPYQRNQRRRNKNVNAYIDESLFGAGPTRKVGGDRDRDSRNTTVVRQRRTQSAPQPVQEQPAVGQSVTISSNELFSMQGASVILSDHEKAVMNARRQDAMAGRMQKANERKERMLRMEADRKRQAPVLSETQMLAREHKNKVLMNAKQKMDEELDDVKDMNQMVTYAQCVTIRDAQIREKENMQRQLSGANRQKDIAMEVERVKQLKMHEERERIRAEEQKIGAQVIVQQIQEREALRLQAQEKREHEAAAMIAKHKELEAVEEQKRLDKISKGREIMDEVIVANKQQARAKLVMKQREIEEDKRIADYIKKKERREQALEMDKELMRELQEKEMGEMRRQREKASGQQHQADELRARRYQEAKDRDWRAKQVELAERKHAMKKNIAEAREDQRRQKAQVMAQQAQQERHEYLRVLEWQKTQNESEEKEKVKVQQMRNRHRTDLYEQITTHDKEKKLAREAFLAQGKEISRQQEIDKLKLLRIKEQKLEDLMASGIPEKYTAELAKKKVLVTSIH